MNILAIDTSTDETSVAVTNGTAVLSNVISTQIRYHKKFGGVVPMLAARLHQERIDSVVALALERSGLDMSQVDAVAVTHGPGLALALQVGIGKAKQLAEDYGKPLYAVNHMRGHIASAFTRVGAKVQKPEFPFLAVLVSGGHTELVMVRSWNEMEILGETLDDALGEAYDKVARMLGLGYPGGRLVSQFAKLGDAHRFELPIPMRRSDTFNLSYSGLKNACRLLIEAQSQTDERLDERAIQDVCAAFELVAQISLVKKVELIVKQYPEIQQVVLAGGVSANAALRQRLRLLLKTFDIPLLAPLSARLCTDNAAMIGVATSFDIAAGAQPIDPQIIDRKPGLRLV